MPRSDPDEFWEWTSFTVGAISTLPVGKGKTRPKKRTVPFGFAVPQKRTPAKPRPRRKS